MNSQKKPEEDGLEINKEIVLKAKGVAAITGQEVSDNVMMIITKTLENEKGEKVRGIIEGTLEEIIPGLEDQPLLKKNGLTVYAVDQYHFEEITRGLTPESVLDSISDIKLMTDGDLSALTLICDEFNNLGTVFNVDIKGKTDTHGITTIEVSDPGQPNTMLSFNIEISENKDDYFIIKCDCNTNGRALIIYKNDYIGNVRAYGDSLLKIIKSNNKTEVFNIFYEMIKAGMFDNQFIEFFSDGQTKTNKTQNKFRTSSED